MNRLVQLSNQLQQYTGSNNSVLSSSLYLLGFLCVSKFVWKFFKFWYKILFRQGLNLIQRYGKDSWALVTGGSDGIGKQLAFQIAQRGFNVILVARNKSKLESVQAELHKLVGNKIQSRIVVADFANSHQNGFFDKIHEQVKDLDISLLVNNVGIDIFERFEEANEQKILDNIIINTMPVTMLCRKIIPSMLKRKNKSGILNVASFAGKLPHPYFQVYTATKAYVITLTKSLKEEFPQLDITILNPSEVSTNMIYNRPPDIMTITPESCARQTLNDMGQDMETNGHWNHKIQEAIYMRVPQLLYTFVVKQFIAPEWFQQRAEGEKRLQEQSKKQN